MNLRRIVVPIVVLVVLAGCGGSKTFSAGDLASILPGKADTPQGLKFLPDSSGNQAIDLIVKDGDQQNKFIGFGFQGAYASFYANDGALAILQQQATPADPAAHVVTMLGVVFKTADGAHKALALDLQKDMATGTNVKQIAVKRIGDETIAESGTQAALPLPAYLIYWREGNAIFAVIDAGGPTAPATLEAAQAFAATMDSRARKA
ncbi:MAG: hypothetical protein E6G04_10015 [Actinobacteria bacterium]|nr:MAG: hypothetical protein E6G04_10015 [Actinomycetota bacterium]